MALKLDSRQATTAIATFVGVMYTVRALWLGFSPDTLVGLLKAAHPFLNVDSLILSTNFYIGSYLMGLVIHVVLAWLVAYLFVYIWNNSHTWFKTSSGRRRRR